MFFISGLGGPDYRGVQVQPNAFVFGGRAWAGIQVDPKSSTSQACTGIQVDPKSGTSQACAGIQVDPKSSTSQACTGIQIDPKSGTSQVCAGIQVDPKSDHIWEPFITTVRVLCWDNFYMMCDGSPACGFESFAVVMFIVFGNVNSFRRLPTCFLAVGHMG